MPTIGLILQNRYRIVAPLGQGGMGAVYRAWDLRLDGAVALKEMIPQPGLDTATLRQLQEQFKQEAVVLRRLHHTHLVRVIDFFEEMGNTYLVMDFVEGEALGDHIKRRGPLPEAEVLAWATQLLDALDYCHRQGVIHRDIKPQNVILRPDGSVVLVDFGLVKLWNPANVQTQTALRGMGSPEYAPPEQYGGSGQHTDARSDLYSLGATLYHALTGQAPPTATERMAMPKLFVPVRQVNPHVSTHVEAAIVRAMALERDQRFGSAAEMAAALQPPALAAHDRRFPVWAWGVLLVILLLAGIVIGRALKPAAPTSQPTPFVTSAVTDTDVSPTSAPTTQPTDIPAATHTPTATAPTSQPVSPTSTGSSATSTPAPTARPTDAPTATHLPTAIPPSPTPVPPSPTPEPSCPNVSGTFATPWSQVQNNIGCSQGSTISGFVVEENFESGKMFWREPIDDAQALVVFNNGTWKIFEHKPFVEGSPEFPCADANTPAQSPPTPKRGFGTMWCDIPEIRSGLGNATDAERGFTGYMQQFDKGFMLQTDYGTIFIFYSNGVWERR